jgi:hypothetical protein
MVAFHGENESTPVSSKSQYPEVSFDPNAPILKIALMANGVILVDGVSSNLDSLRTSISSIAQRKGMVWYYREAAHTEAPPQSAEIVKLIAENRFPVRLSTQPDYSDSVGMDGKPVGRDGKPIQQHSLQSPAERDEDKFGPVRTKAAQGQLVVVRPDGKYLLFPALRVDSVRAEMVAAVERMLPSTTKRNVAVIADTAWANAEGPTLQMASQAVPFFGLLMGFSSIGHSVWLFDGAANVFAPGCRQADVLIVDGALVSALPLDWQRDAARVMRNPQILLHDRTTHQFRKP